MLNYTLYNGIKRLRATDVIIDCSLSNERPLEMGERKNSALPSYRERFLTYDLARDQAVAAELLDSSGWRKLGDLEANSVSREDSSLDLWSRAGGLRAAQHGKRCPLLLLDQLPSTPIEGATP